jgi:protein-S-isoprenylcysteine O-methyltransferase Ste14
VDTHKVVVQTIGKAAAKTALQAFLAVFVPLFLLWVTGNTAVLTNQQNGGNIDIDFNPVMAAAVAGGLAALAASLSALWNWSKGPTSDTPVVVQPPVVVDK